VRRPLPIAILSYNRPDYLEQVLETLAPTLLPDDRCFLFQDGGWDPISRERTADEDVLHASVAIFQRLIPQGQVFASPVNLGIAGNYRRTERYLFEALGVDEALFLEDDLLLSPDYLTVTADLLTIAAQSGQIGYVSAYGDFWASLVQQEASEGTLVRMHENWGAAMMRASWLKQRPVREMYWSIVRHRAYRQRDNEAVVRLYTDLGYQVKHTSQDASRWVACAHAGLVRLTTATCHARYIGAVGEHSTQDRFEQYHFDKSVMFPRAPVLKAPKKAEIKAWLAQDRAALKDGYRHSYEIAIDATKADKRPKSAKKKGGNKRAVSTPPR
jgi:hypothetical protein